MSMFELREQASPISKGVTEIRINSHLARENNLITRHTRATKATRVATYRYGYQRVGSGPTLPLCRLPCKNLAG
jgi:hypothetical protein